MADNFLAREICGLSKSTEEIEKKTKTLGRRLSRRLSLVAKVPSLINLKLKQDNDVLEPYTGDGKYFNVTVIAPDKTQRIIECQKGQTIRSSVSPILAEFGIDNYKLYLAGSLAIADENVEANYLYDNILIIEEKSPVLNIADVCNRIHYLIETFLDEEMEYIKILNSASELYDNSVSSNGDQNESALAVILRSFNALSMACTEMLKNLKSVLDSGSDSLDEISRCFNDHFWEEYDVYLRSYKISRRILRQRKLQDEQFTQLCRLRQGAAKYSLQQIVDLPVQRLSEYERYFESLLAESRSENLQNNVEEINNTKAKCKQAAKRGQRESDLERIQDLFPNDCLRLYDADALTMKVKGLMRKRSGAAARLQRALSTKSLRSESPPPSQKTPISNIEQRTFLMEAPVQFSTGVQSQDRHLFLFNDLLLIAKARSGGNFKLKEKVRISEIWLTKTCIDDVSELNKSEDTSFVLGWPTTNVVVTFSTQAARDLWWNKLLEVFRAENEKEPCSTNIQVVYYDLSTNIEYCKTFSVGPDETARDCIRVSLEHLEMRNLDCANFQLWVKTARDESPYPLVGHERPFAIKLSCLRDSLSSEDGFDLDHCNNVHDPVARCHFILRNNVKNSAIDNKKSSKKSSTRTMKIGQVFRRNKDQSSCLFGLPLCKVTDGETLPKPIMSMLYQVFAKGPFMQGIFRKSANARQVRELRDKLDAGVDVTWEHVPVLVTAALLKEFLRSLPDPLLTTALYAQWRTAVEERNLNTKLRRLKDVLGQLPKPNNLLLIHFLCVLYHIARRSCHTLMSAANLGVCVGPSLLWSDCPNVSDDLRIVPSVVECLITHCEYLCGSHVPSLLGDLRDSGTEESDSMKRDDSSIDSLECSPPPRKDKISLSRDSGLTMSDSQLYTPDEEESGSTSSSGYDPAFESHPKVSSSVSMPVNYVRVYGGWEERLNPNYFQRQAWFRQRSRRMNSQSANKNDVRRTASEESLLDNTSEPPPAPPRRNKANYGYDQTPVYSRKNAVIIPRRIDVTSKSSESDVDRSKGDDESTSSFQTTPAYRKESNKPAVPKSEPFVVERRSLPFNDLSINCDSTTTSPASRENHYSNVCVNSSTGRLDDETMIPFGSGDYYYAVREQIEDAKNVECEDSSTLSDEDCTPHVSRSNSRGNEVVSTLRYSPAAAHTDTCVVRGRVKRKEDRAAIRSRSLPPPPPYRPPPPATSRRAPITSYYLGDCNQIQNYVITRTYMDEESYV